MDKKKKNGLKKKNYNNNYNFCYKEKLSMK